MRYLLSALSLSALLIPVQSLYFYMDGTKPKCFFEELPKDTLVVGLYSADEYNYDRKEWKGHEGLNIQITVDVRKLSLHSRGHQFTVPHKTNQELLSRKSSTMTTASLIRKELHQEDSHSPQPTQATTKSASIHHRVFLQQAGSTLTTWEESR